jgi:prolyl-tRNA synthetase
VYEYSATTHGTRTAGAQTTLAFTGLLDCHSIQTWYSHYLAGSSVALYGTIKNETSTYAHTIQYQLDGKTVQSVTLPTPSQLDWQVLFWQVGIVEFIPDSDQLTDRYFSVPCL